MTRLAPTLCLLIAACSGSDDPKTPSEGDGTTGSTATEDSGAPADPFAVTSCADHADPCVQIEGGDNDTLFDTVNLLEDNMTIVLGAGVWTLDNQVTIRGASGISIIGQGMDETVLDFALEAVQTNGIDAVGDNFLVQDLTVKDAKKDGVRVEDSNGVVMRRVRATWTAEESPENGAYGLYPVKSENVLIEDCEAFNAADAGIYVGQTIKTIVRRNTARGNVAGIEIENTQFADVYDNLATENTGGLLIFDLPGNPIVGHDVWVHNNTIVNNNTPNFAPGGTVAMIPSGTGTVVIATRRVVVENNEYSTNNSSDVAVFSGLVIEGNADDWYLTNEELVGDMTGVQVPSDEGGIYNYQTRNIVVQGNTHSGSGTMPDASDGNAREIGMLLFFVYLGDRVDDVLYDSIGESAFSTTDATANSNDNHICVGGNTGGTFASLNIEALAARFGGDDAPGVDDLFRPPAPFTPFDCTELQGEPLPEITLD
ncbi:MAG: hypothetical protein CL927_02630 [Deltaproteobacteria bacterium]|nr:hypothetical protein [Deltaproteobacteria bacterium]HCH64627.1 hypothetical protein [Deltaproteobacteria bacterium]